MEFDKNKVLTVVTADQAKIGQKGWFANILTQLEKKVNKEPFDFIENVKLSGDTRFPFRSEHVGYNWALFYPAPEQTYAERQAQWVEENNVREGTKVRVTRTFTEDEDGSCCLAHDDLVGETGVVRNIAAINLGVDINDRNFSAVPYFALEVIKEPTYRPFANAEEFKPYRDEWFRSKHSSANGNVKYHYYNDNGVRNSIGDFIPYAILFEEMEIDKNGEPCGVKE